MHLGVHWEGSDIDIFIHDDPPNTLLKSLISDFGATIMGVTSVKAYCNEEMHNQFCPSADLFKKFVDDGGIRSCIFDYSDYAKMDGKYQNYSKWCDACMNGIVIDITLKHIKRVITIHVPSRLRIQIISVRKSNYTCLKRFINDQFDFDFCKVYFDGNTLTVLDQESVDTKTCKLRRSVDHYYKKRVDKYKDRGFTITSESITRFESCFQYGDQKPYNRIIDFERLENELPNEEKFITQINNIRNNTDIYTRLFNIRLKQFNDYQEAMIITKKMAIPHINKIILKYLLLIPGDDYRRSTTPTVAYNRFFHHIE
jgi:hypothetical protein